MAKGIFDLRQHLFRGQIIIAIINIQKITRDLRISINQAACDIRRSVNEKMIITTLTLKPWTKQFEGLSEYFGD